MKQMIRTTFEQCSGIRMLHSGGRVIASAEGELVTICGDIVNVVNGESGSVIHSFTDNAGSAVTATALGPSLLAYATADLQVRVFMFDVAAKEFSLVKQWAAAQNTSISALAFSPSGDDLCTACGDGTAKVWNVRHFHLTHNFANGAGVTTVVRFLTLGTSEWISFGSFEGKITIWDLASKRKVQTISENVQSIDLIEVMPSGAVIIGGRDRKLVVMQRKSDKALLTVSHSFVVKENVTGMAFGCSPVPMLVTVTEGGDVAFYNLAALPTVTQSFRSDAEGVVGEGISFVEYCKDRCEVVLVSNSHNIVVLDATSGAVKRCVVGNLDLVVGLSHLQRDGLVLAINNSPTVHLFRPGQCMSVRRLMGHDEVVLCAATSHDQRFIATGSKDKVIRIWDTENDFRCVAVCNGHTGDVTGLAFNQDPKSSLTSLASVAGDDCMKIWTLSALRSTKKAKTEGSNKTSNVMQITASVSDTVAHVHQGGVYTVAFAPNDQFVATGGKDKTAKLWTWKPKEGIEGYGTLKGHRRAVYQVAFSPVEKMLATASGDKTVKLFSLSDFSCVRTFQGHDDAVLSVQFLSKGLQLATASADGLVKLWVVQNGSCAATLDGHEDKVWSVCVSDDGARLFTGGADASLLEWSDVTEEKKEEERANYNRHVVEQQELENCLRESRFEDAFMLSLKLGHPRHLFETVRQWNNAVEIGLCVKGLSEDMLKKVVMYSRDFLTMTKKSRIGHALLFAVLTTRHPTELLKYGWMKDLVEVCLSYTKKYHTRATNQMQEMHFLDFLEHCVNPETGIKRLRE